MFGAGRGKGIYRPKDDRVLRGWCEWISNKIKERILLIIVGSLRVVGEREIQPQNKKKS